VSPGYPIEIVPVIDLKDGCVVRARAGERDRYRPIETPLSPTADPVDVVSGLLSVVPARTLYVADLDAIERRGDNRACLERLAAAFPALSLWIDAGIESEREAELLLSGGVGRIVIGSESQAGDSLLRSLRESAILSLDFRGDAFLGPPALRDDPSLWPRDVIVMTLARVGTGMGPDLAKLQAVRGQRPDARTYAAGGVRGRQDLAALATIGVTGALVASAIHDGLLSK
jgi:phosphoribosylformimino-5-aminoimidazole carboxamide ribotide isomerase